MELRLLRPIFGSVFLDFPLEFRLVPDFEFEFFVFISSAENVVHFGNCGLRKGVEAWVLFL